METKKQNKTHSWIAEIPSLSSLRSIVKSSNLNHFQLVSV